MIPAARLQSHSGRLPAAVGADGENLAPGKRAIGVKASWSVCDDRGCRSDEEAGTVELEVVAASASPEAASEVQSRFSTSSFRIYTNDDVLGVELGGALKNVIAIAVGVITGLGLGSMYGLLALGLVRLMQRERGEPPDETGEIRLHYPADRCRHATPNPTETA